MNRVTKVRTDAATRNDYIAQRMSSATIELLTSPEFLRALLIGAIAAVIVGAVAYRRPGDGMGLVGVGVTVAFMAALFAAPVSTPQLGSAALGTSARRRSGS